MQAEREKLVHLKSLKMPVFQSQMSEFDENVNEYSMKGKAMKTVCYDSVKVQIGKEQKQNLHPD